MFGVCFRPSGSEQRGGVSETNRSVHETETKSGSSSLHGDTGVTTVSVDFLEESARNVLPVGSSVLHEFHPCLWRPVIA